MMPPTSIDGTDITGATIDGTDVTEITVDGQTVFEAAKVVDNFDANDLTSKWNTSGVNGSFSGYNAVTSPVEGGSHALEITTGSNNNIFLDASGTQDTPALGDTQEFYVNSDNNTNIFIMWLSDKNEADQDIPRGHWIRIREDAAQIRLGNSSASAHNDTQNAFSVTIPSGYNRYEISYTNSNNTLNCEGFDTSNNLFFSGSVNTSNNGFGTSCAIHSRNPTTCFFDTWKII